MKNLIQFDEMPPEKHRALSSKGGRASGEARRRKSYMRQDIQETMERALIAENLINDINEFNCWRKRREARTKRERTKRKKD